MHFNPNFVGPSASPTLLLSPFVPGELSPKRISSDPITNSLVGNPSYFQEPRTPALRRDFARWAKFESSSPVVKNMLLLLYGSREAYVQNNGHPLEDFFEAFDQSIGDDETTRAVAAAVGFFVEYKPEFTAWELLVDKVVSYIEVMEKKRENDPQYPGRPNTQEIIQMTRKTFDKYAIEKNYESSLTLYQDRLNFFRYWSMTAEERQKEDDEDLEATHLFHRTLPADLYKQKYYNSGY